MKKEFTKTRGIYYLYDRDELVYIGSSAFCEKRIYSHVDKKFTDYEIIPMLDKKGSALTLLEAQEIAQKTPRYNRSLPECDCFMTKNSFCLKYHVSKDIRTIVRKEIKDKLSPLVIYRGIVYYALPEMVEVLHKIKKNAYIQKQSRA